MAIPHRKVPIGVRYRANHRTTVIKNCYYNGTRIRESDSAVIMTIVHPSDNRTISIEVGLVEAIWLGGKMRKLRSPAEKFRLREAEIKHLLEGKQLEDWTSPYLRSYDTDQFIVRRSPLAKFFGDLVSLSGAALLSLPMVACLGITGVIGYMVLKLANHVH